MGLESGCLYNCYKSMLIASRIWTSMSTSVLGHQCVVGLQGSRECEMCLLSLKRCGHPESCIQCQVGSHAYAAAALLATNAQASCKQLQDG